MHHRHQHASHDRHEDHDGRGMHGRRFGRHGHGGPGRHGHHDREGGRPGGGRARLGRFFEQGDLRLVMLQLIADKPRHGYELIKAIEEKVAGSYSPSPGVIYPTLTLLEELGQVTVDATEGGKKLHTITVHGLGQLAANRAAVDAIFTRMTEVSDAHGGGPAPQVVRAMENLKLALRMRVSRGPLGDDQINAVAAAIDAAATAIERT